MKRSYHPLFKTDVIQAATHYDMNQPGLGDSFKQVLEEALERLALTPLRWRKFRGPYRRCNLKRFPYYIVFRFDERDDIIVFALVHERRHPDSWINRAKDEL